MCRKGGHKVMCRLDVVEMYLIIVFVFGRTIPMAQKNLIDELYQTIDIVALLAIALIHIFLIYHGEEHVRIYMHQQNKPNQ
jgi:hypothetical protein